MRTVDLFCGCGGMSLGFQNAGVDILASFDNWEPAISVYKDNFDHPIFNLDLNLTDAIDQIRTLKPDMIIGGHHVRTFL